MKLGQLEVDAVVDGVACLPPTQLYELAHQAPIAGQLGATATDWVGYEEHLDEAGNLEMPVGGFLVRRGDRVALVDAGMGPNPPLPCIGGLLVQRLRELGVELAAVTDVILTHLHFDHIGWVSVDDAPVFPNATYRCDARDWEHFAGPATDPRVRDKLRCLEDRMDLWDTDTTILPGLDTLHAPGHTPGSTIVVMSSGTERALLLGDVVHCPIELVEPEWQGLSDVDPVLAKVTRDRVAAELEATSAPAAAAHFPGLRFGRLLPANGRRRWIIDGG